MTFTFSHDQTKLHQKSLVVYYPVEPHDFLIAWHFDVSPILLLSWCLVCKRYMCRLILISKLYF